MTSPVPAATATWLEKVAHDNGFELERPPEGDWLAYAGSHTSLKLWLRASEGAHFVAALSQRRVLEALGEHGEAYSGPLPQGAAGARRVSDIAALHRLVRRAFQLSVALPDAPLVAFEKQTATFPKATEAERLVVQRVGQEVFRKGLFEYWEGRCSITGLAVPELLRASHIKPWADCASDAERLDVFNGLLLAPHLDAAFDRGFITVEDDGEVRVSARLDGEARGTLGLDAPLRVRALAPAHRAYLPWHRERVFK